jgi:putative membrane protein
MITSRGFRIKILWLMGKDNIVKSFLLSLLVVILYDFFDVKFLAVPSILLASIGTAVAFYVGFKNNQAYDRLWNASKIWESIYSNSRSLFIQLNNWIKDEDEKRHFIQMHIVYLQILKLELRKQVSWNRTNEKYLSINNLLGIKEVGYEEEMDKILKKYALFSWKEALLSKSNKATYALNKQFEWMFELSSRIEIAENEYSELLKNLNELNRLQSASETFKYTPLYRQYSIFSSIFINLFNFLLPFSLLAEFDKTVSWGSWLTIPFTMLVSWVFYTMEQIGDISENPFENSAVDIPIDFICNQIENEICEICDMKGLGINIAEPSNILM